MRVPRVDPGCHPTPSTSQDQPRGSSRQGPSRGPGVETGAGPLELEPEDEEGHQPQLYSFPHEVVPPFVLLYRLGLHLQVTELPTTGTVPPRP